MTGGRTGAGWPGCGLALAVLASSLGSGCGGKQTVAQSDTDPDFDCRERRVAYIVANSFAGPELGVVIDCAERGPRIKKWIVTDDAGNRQDGEHSLGTGEFDDIWTRIESTGWRQLGDCDTPEPANDDEPAYKFGIKDHEQSASLSCAGKELPFPYDRLVNELDLKAAEYGI